VFSRVRSLLLFGDSNIGVKRAQIRIKSVQLVFPFAKVRPLRDQQLMPWQVWVLYLFIPLTHGRLARMVCG